MPVAAVRVDGCQYWPVFAGECFGSSLCLRTKEQQMMCDVGLQLSCRTLEEHV